MINPWYHLRSSLLTWLQRVLYVEHGGPVAIHHALLNLVFGHVAAAIFYPDARLQVVEVAPVELEELDEEDGDVGVGTAHVLPVVELRANTIRAGVSFTGNDLLWS